MEPKRFVVASGPTGARLLFAGLVRQTIPEIEIVNYGLHEGDNYRGSHTDYRYELKLASEQALEKPEKHTLYTHSLIDGLAYSTLKVERYRKHKSVSEYTFNTALLTLALIGAMFRDSFKYDEIFFLDVFPKDTEGRVVQDRVQMVLDEFELPYTILPAASENYEWVDEAINTIQAHLED